MIIVVRVVVSVALLGLDMVNCSCDDGGDQLIGANPDWVKN